MKLPRVQLHLATCIVLMFVTGGLIWENVAVEEKVEQVRLLGIQGQSKPRYVSREYLGRGWPLAVTDFFDPADRSWSNLPRHEHFRQDWKLYISINLFTALAILAATAFICEWIIRRRAQQRANS